MENNITDIVGMIFVGLLCIAILAKIGRIVFRVLKIFYYLIKNLFFNRGKNDLHHVELYKGKIVKEKSWHGGNDAVLYSEFWLKRDDGVERKYNLTGIHPELRTGHEVAIYELNGEIALINNSNTRNDRVVLSRRKIARMYPTGRLSKVVIWGMLIFGVYKWQFDGNGFVLFVATFTFLSYVLITLIKHWFSLDELWPERYRKVRELCYSDSVAN